MASLTPGTIVDGRLTYEDAADQWKWRPVVVLSVDANGISVLPCTTVEKPGPRQVALTDWLGAGLARPTHVTLRPRKLARSDLGVIRGHLTSGDESRLRSILTTLGHRSDRIAAD